MQLKALVPFVSPTEVTLILSQDKRTTTLSFLGKEITWCFPSRYLFMRTRRCARSPMYRHFSCSCIFFFTGSPVFIFVSGNTRTPVRTNHSGCDRWRLDDVFLFMQIIDRAREPRQRLKHCKHEVGGSELRQFL